MSIYMFTYTWMLSHLIVHDALKTCITGLYFILNNSKVWSSWTSSPILISFHIFVNASDELDETTWLTTQLLSLSCYCTDLSQLNQDCLSLQTVDCFRATWKSTPTHNNLRSILCFQIVFIFYWKETSMSFMLWKILHIFPTGILQVLGFKQVFYPENEFRYLWLFYRSQWITNVKTLQ
jgi:hypothetical protein